MSAQFEHFARLSAELRASIWSLSLQLQRGNNHKAGSPTLGRQIEFYKYDSKMNSVAIAISQRYPTLFAVSREARYEAAKLMHCTWIPVYARYDSSTEPAHMTQFEICINFKLDTVNLRARFLKPPSPLGWLPARPNPEQHRLNTLARLLDYETLQNVESILIDASPPILTLRLEIDAWWKGEGLDVFCPGKLRQITIMTEEKPVCNCRDYSQWLVASVRDEIHDRWTLEGSNSEKPAVKVSRFCEQQVSGNGD